MLKYSCDCLRNLQKKCLMDLFRSSAMKKMTNRGLFRSLITKKITGEIFVSFFNVSHEEIDWSIFFGVSLQRKWLIDLFWSLVTKKNTDQIFLSSATKKKIDFFWFSATKKRLTKNFVRYLNVNHEETDWSIFFEVYPQIKWLIHFFGVWLRRRILVKLSHEKKTY